eukprot:sb/3465045/
MQHPKEAIFYSFLVDASSPSHLKLSDKIFEADIETDVGYNPDPTMRMGVTYSDCNNTASQKVATDLGVEGNYGAFSGSASMAVSTSSDKSIKTCRLDAYCVAGIASVVPIGQFKNFPHEYLTEAFKKSVKEHSFEEFSTRIGVFYAADITLGGRVNKSYTMQASKEDNQVSVTTELEASYGAGCWGVTGTASNSVSNRTSNEKSQMKTEWRAQGGNTKLWLGCSFGPNSDADTVAKEWADSVEPENSYPIKMSLRPIWELVKKVDADKGAGLEAYLKGKWAQDANEFNPSNFLELAPKISKHANNKKMMERAKAHYNHLRDEGSKAQGWMDTWYAQTDYKRNENWKNAAEQGKKQMDEIEKKVKGDMTVEDFKEWLDTQWKDADIRSKHSWGLGGHDSGESNRVQASTRDAIGEIRKMC